MHNKELESLLTTPTSTNLSRLISLPVRCHYNITNLMLHTRVLSRLMQIGSMQARLHTPQAHQVSLRHVRLNTLLLAPAVRRAKLGRPRNNHTILSLKLLILTQSRSPNKRIHCTSNKVNHISTLPAQTTQTGRVSPSLILQSLSIINLLNRKGSLSTNRQHLTASLIVRQKSTRRTVNTLLSQRHPMNMQHLRNRNNQLSANFLHMQNIMRLHKPTIALTMTRMRT